MERIENNVRRLLGGQAIDENQECCDFTLADQNEAIVAKGITPSASPDYVPKLQSTVHYIVVGVLINERGEVLLMQEAKRSCAGQWYLPAGRLELGEDFMEGVVREVLEETGLEMEPTTLVMVETAGGSWYRFVATGRVQGGTLKTPKDANSESLQAKWVKNVAEYSLRCSDILPIIELCRQYHARGMNDCWHSVLLPALVPHQKLLLRLLVCIRKRSNNRIHVLISEKNEVHLPTCEINPTRSVHCTLKKFMTEIFGADVPPHKPHGVLSVEHTGKPEGTNDGFCMTLLVSFRRALEEVGIIDKYSWFEISPQIADEILERMPKNMVVHLNVISFRIKMINDMKLTCIC